MTDRQPNNMQRVFMALKVSREMMSVPELVARLGFTSAMVRQAIGRLRRQRCTRAVYEDGAWRYGLATGAQFPPDERGRRRRG